MSLNWSDIFDLLRALLDSEWSVCPVSFQNEDFSPPFNAPWIYAEILPIEGGGSDFNSPGLRVASGLGLIALHVFVPTGTGTRDAFDLADQLAALLRFRTLSTGVETAVASVGGGTSSDDEGNWFRVSVTTPLHINTTV
jgi:hypothetical protein